MLCSATLPSPESACHITVHLNRAPSSAQRRVVYLLYTGCSVQRTQWKWRWKWTDGVDTSPCTRFRLDALNEEEENTYHRYRSLRTIVCCPVCPTAPCCMELSHLQVRSSAGGGLSYRCLDIGGVWKLTALPTTYLPIYRPRLRRTCSWGPAGCTSDRIISLYI